MQSASRVNRRTLLFLGVFVSALGIAFIPIYLHPKFYPEIYREKQRPIREKYTMEETQPGGMKVWENPFRKKEK